MRTSSIRESAIDALYSTCDDRLTLRSAASNRESVARSSEPLGRTSFSTAKEGTPLRSKPAAGLVARATNPAAGIGEGPEPTNVARHLHRDQRGVLAHVVAARALGAGQRLALVLGRQHAERHRDAGGELHVLDAPGALPGDQ